MSVSSTDWKKSRRKRPYRKLFVFTVATACIFSFGTLRSIGDFGVIVVAADDSLDIPVLAPNIEIQYPIRVLGTRSHERLPDVHRCRWLPSGSDAWVANETQAWKWSPESPNNSTLDQMFRSIVSRYQGDEKLREKLTIASSPDALPKRVRSDYIYEEDDDDENDENILDEDDPYAWYLHEGDGGPWVLLIDDFLDGNEADQLIKLGQQEGYQKSTIVVDDDDDEEEDDEDDFDDIEYIDEYVDEYAVDIIDSNVDDYVDENADEDVDDFSDVGDEDDFDANSSFTEGEDEQTRTSSTAWCESEDCKNDEVAKNVVDRIYDLVGMNEPHSEHIQLLYYKVGEFYNEHHDYYHVSNATEWSQDGGRILTVFLYLNDVEGGGSTDFPRLNLTVTPKRGRAVLWPSILDHKPSKLDWRTEHAAREVTKGVKYGANLWFHMKPYRKKWFNYECDAPEVESVSSVASSSNANSNDINDGVIWHDDYDAYYDDEDYDNEDQDLSDGDNTLIIWDDVEDDDDFDEDDLSCILGFNNAGILEEICTELL